MKRGKLFIYNVYFFANGHIRQNSEKDVIALTNTFKRMNINNDVEDLSEDTLDQIRTKVKCKLPGSALLRLQQKIKHRIIEQDFADYDFVVFAILSHGSEDGKFVLYDQSCSLEEEFLKPLIKNNSLAGKFKWIISGCCRGALKDKKFSENGEELPVENHKYYLLSFATTEGCVAWRPNVGNIFIQILCSTLEEKKNDDIITILSEVRKTVEKLSAEQRQVMQTPSPKHNMGFFTFYFAKTKERFIRREWK